jgi:hypothetical protein
MAPSNRDVVSETSRFLYASHESDKHARKAGIKKRQSSKILSSTFKTAQILAETSAMSLRLVGEAQKKLPGGHNVVVVDDFRERFQPGALGDGLLRRLLDHLQENEQRSGQKPQNLTNEVRFPATEHKKPETRGTLRGYLAMPQTMAWP